MDGNKVDIEKKVIYLRFAFEPTPCFFIFKKFINLSYNY